MAITPSTKYTYDDFVLMPDDNRRREIIDGDLYVYPSPFTKHQAVSGSLMVLLGLHLREHRLGVAYHALFDVIFSDMDIVEPDIIYVSNERANFITEKNTQGAPDLLIEILGESPARQTRSSSGSYTSATCH